MPVLKERTFGCRPLEHLEDPDWFFDWARFASGIHFSWVDGSGAGITRCPGSHMVPVRRPIWKPQVLQSVSA